MIETGTYKGAMLDSCKGIFNKLYSIELDLKLFNLALEKYQDEPKIHNIQGDSGVELKKLINNINEPCVFWLDGHYSGGVTARSNIDTPISNEIKAIFNHKINNHIILIDDARLFDGTNDYPTLQHLKEIVGKFDPEKK